MTANTAAIGLNATAIEGKADQSAVDANTSAIAGKADQSALDALAVAVSNNTSEVASNGNRIEVLEGFHEGCYADPAPEWIENDDGTATQCSTGLMWEMKTEDDSIHDVDNHYTWSGPSLGTTNEFDGTAKTDFLDILNTTPCFAGYCDWRLPNIVELAGGSSSGPVSASGGILNLNVGACAGLSGACTTVPGSTAADAYPWYWSATTRSNSPGLAYDVQFTDAVIGGSGKGNLKRVRAVRGGTCVSDQWYTCP